MKLLAARKWIMGRGHQRPPAKPDFLIPAPCPLNLPCRDKITPGVPCATQRGKEIFVGVLVRAPDAMRHEVLHC